MSEIYEVPAPRRYTWTYVVMLVSSALALLAALVLSIDSWKLAKDPTVALACDINAKISCGKVAESWQSVIFGFPNAFLGLIAETVVVTVAIAALTGSRFNRLFLLTAQIGYTGGLAFAYWMFYQSYFNIGVLCPWCLVITFTTTAVFATITRINLLENTLRLSDRTNEKIARALSLNADAAVVFIVWAILASAILFHYA